MDNHRIALAVMLLLAGCAVQKPVPPQVIVRDSVVYRDRIVRDSVAYPVPVEVEKIVTRDTSSHLENSWGMSDAVVSGGFLSHSLETKPRTIYVPVEVHVTDTLIVEKEAEIHTETVTVEKELNWWQKFRLGAFWWLVLAVVGLLVWTFRKVIFNFIKI